MTLVVDMKSVLTLQWGMCANVRMAMRDINWTFAVSMDFHLKCHMYVYTNVPVNTHCSIVELVIMYVGNG